MSTLDRIHEDTRRSPVRCIWQRITVITPNRLRIQVRAEGRQWMVHRRHTINVTSAIRTVVLNSRPPRKHTRLRRVRPTAGDASINVRRVHVGDTGRMPHQRHPTQSEKNRRRLRDGNPQRHQYSDQSKHQPWPHSSIYRRMDCRRAFARMRRSAHGVAV